MRIENELKLDFSDVLIRPKINLVFLNNKDNQSVLFDSMNIKPIASNISK
jgi:hypothetical protein